MSLSVSFEETLSCVAVFWCSKVDCIICEGNSYLSSVNTLIVELELETEILYNKKIIIIIIIIIILFKRQNRINMVN